MDIRRKVVCTDSLSAVKAIKDVTTQNQLVQRLQRAIHPITLSGKEVTILWIPGPSGIAGNDRADGEAKSAATLDPQLIHISYTNWDRKIRQTTYDKWRKEWRGTRQQLRQIKGDPGRRIRSRVTRRKEIVLTRLRTSYTRLTHEYMIQGVWERRVCGWCSDAYLTVEHILVGCDALAPMRARVMGPHVNGELTLKELLGEEANPLVVMEYLTWLGLVDML